jgi:hypothetical protein
MTVPSQSPEATESPTYTAFDGEQLIAKGELRKVVLQVKKRMMKAQNASPLIFNDWTGRVMDFDLRGSEKEVLGRMQIYFSRDEGPKNAGPGRPRLGVVPREVSLLPRHWEWLASQPGGASATLRKLVEGAKKTSLGENQVKQAQERTYKFMSVLAGDLPGFEEALRALYKKDESQFKARISTWPRDVREHTQTLAWPVFEMP